MIYKIDAKKIPGTIEKIKEIDLPEGAIPLKVETWLEQYKGEGMTEVLRGLYADRILYYNNKEKIFNNDNSEMTIMDENENPTVYKTFLLLRYIIPSDK